jgi:hypothetical protein
MASQWMHWTFGQGPGDVIFSMGRWHVYLRGAIDYAIFRTPSRPSQENLIPLKAKSGFLASGLWSNF